ncbi:hypothetical protein EST38_g11828 [Candolleomyces aberdarensis]|uniref:Uncharacterized protein n=1 Tax=Candolleomyces aberdarensis TaxID=2316362 RepID=A0A4Q2D675_9AGAR|nr:hypothetical protein EST38_g11828 [Candolleomyces aberdarensis]
MYVIPAQQSLNMQPVALQGTVAAITVVDRLLSAWNPSSYPHNQFYYQKIISLPETSMSDTIDLDGDPDSRFDPAKWIGVGKQYPDEQCENIPFELRAAREEAFAIPPMFKTWTPHLSMPISTLIQEDLPTISAELNMMKISQCFKRDIPTATTWKQLEVLDTRSIPSKATVNELEKASSQAWLDGNRSVSDPRYNNGEDRMPLWLVSFWKSLMNVVEEQDEWKAAAEWVNGRHKEWKGDNGKHDFIKNSLTKVWIRSNLFELVEKPKPRVKHGSHSISS